MTHSRNGISTDRLAPLDSCEDIGRSGVCRVVAPFDLSGSELYIYYREVLGDTVRLFPSPNPQTNLRSSSEARLDIYHVTENFCRIYSLP